MVKTRLQSWLTGLPLGALRPDPPKQTAANAGTFRIWVAPALVMIVSFLLTIPFWMACVYHRGSFLDFLQAGPSSWLAHLPHPTFTALLIFLGWVAFQALLLKFLPGKRYLGPPTPTGQQPEYRLNGILAWLVTHIGIFGIAWPLGWLHPGALYKHYGSLLALLTPLAFVFCLFLYVKGRTYPSTSDNVYMGKPFFDFFQGIELHPRLFGFNLKQLINCRVSMMGWSVISCSFLVAQYEQTGSVSAAMWVSVIVHVVYLFKFFWWEGGYFHSLDIMHDRFGYYICWGVLAWVPSVYCLVTLWLVSHPIHLHPAVAIGYVALGLLAIWINYAADAQRRRVRDTQGQTTVWGKTPVLIRAKYTTSDGEQRENLLLASGWWGVARHFHYVPELVLAAAWTLPAGFTHFLPWFYWLFLFILLMDRSIRDEKRCAQKYGPDWQRYTQQVRWRVLPGIF